MLSIGSFSLMTGLSITALRHYDLVGVLRPAEVNRDTGYRRYHESQLGDGRALALLRRVKVPVEAMRQLAHTGLNSVLMEHRTSLEGQSRVLAEAIALVDRVLEKGLPMTTSRITQVTIVADDLDRSVAFYRTAFDAEFIEEIRSFQFGRYPDDDFFLLTVADPELHPWPGGPAKFGLLVADVDAAHARALTAGGTEVAPPVDQPWKPRSSTVQDPSGNQIDLYAGG